MADPAAFDMATTWAALWPLIVVLAGSLVTYAWRALGVYLAGRIPAESPIFDWVACVAYALLAGLIARMIVLPLGPLAETELSHRVSAAVLSLAIVFLTRNNLLFGVGAGAAALVLLTLGWR